MSLATLPEEPFEILYRNRRLRIYLGAFCRARPLKRHKKVLHLVIFSMRCISMQKPR